LKLRVIALTLPPSLVSELDALASALRVPRSKLARLALTEWMAQRDQAQTAVDEDGHMIAADEPQIVADLAGRMEQSTLRRLERAGPRERKAIEELAKLLAAPLSRFLAHCRKGIRPTRQDALWFCAVQDQLRGLLDAEFPADELADTVIAGIAIAAGHFADRLHHELYPNDEVVADAGASNPAR
jgi:predicted transcriptional regulator